MRKCFAILLILFASVASTSCGGGGSDDDSLTFLLLFLLLNNQGGDDTTQPNAEYLSRAQTALGEWQLGLATGATGTSRTTNSGSQYNPVNWITVSDENCNVIGMPDSLRNGGCGVGGSTIGVCWTRWYTSGSVGELIDTTAVMLDSYQASSSVSDAEKLAVVTHEIGHCFGYNHSGSTADIMYFSSAGANSPSAAEITEAQSVYAPCCSAPGGTARWNTEGGTAVRHHSFPLFTISGTIGNGYSIETEPPPPGPPITGSVVTVGHFLHADGREEIVIRDQFYRPID